MVSVIIIFLNMERFLPEAIESVLAQTYGDWELLLVNDGSTDASPEIARRAARLDPKRVRYLEHLGGQNCGMSASRNLGLRHAAGQYIAFLDADDVWEPETLAEQVAILEQQREAALVYGPLLYWYSWSGKVQDSRRDVVEELGVAAGQIIRPPRLLVRFLTNRAAVPSGMLVRREVFDRVGGFEESFRGEYEDQVFCAKVCLSLPVYAAGRCWYRYRQHPASSVALGQASGQTHAARQVFLNWLAAYLRAQRVFSPAVWWALWKESWRFTHPGLFWLTRRWRHFARRAQSRLHRRKRLPDGRPTVK